jgi:phosphomevalonate kinase
MKITAPGKLMLSGEWSVLENEVPCIVLAIDQKVSVEIENSDNIEFSSSNGLSAKVDFENDEIKVNGSEDEQKFFLFVAKATEATLKYLKEKDIKIKNFKIHTDSSDTVVKLENGKNAKVGFGSSAAIVSATVAAVLKIHGIGIKSKEEKDLIYKLSCISHYLAQGKLGSSFDVAASTYGGVLIYQKPDMDFVLDLLNQNKKVSEIVEKDWPFFKAENISLPKDFNLSIGFVGYSASTKELVLRIREFKQKNKNDYWVIIDEIKKVTLDLINALKNNNTEKIIDLTKKNRDLLSELSDKSMNNLETPELAKLADIAERLGACGKFSGAGGGDCGIGISFDKLTKDKIESEWQENKIHLIDANISNLGVSLE